VFVFAPIDYGCGDWRILLLRGLAGRWLGDRTPARYLQPHAAAGTRVKRMTEGLDGYR